MGRPWMLVQQRQQQLRKWILQQQLNPEFPHHFQLPDGVLWADLLHLQSSPSTETGSSTTSESKCSQKKE